MCPCRPVYKNPSSSCSKPSFGTIHPLPRVVLVNYPRERASFAIWLCHRGLMGAAAGADSPEPCSAFHPHGTPTPPTGCMPVVPETFRARTIDLSLRSFSAPSSRRDRQPMMIAAGKGSRSFSSLLAQLRAPVFSPPPDQGLEFRSSPSLNLLICKSRSVSRELALRDARQISDRPAPADSSLDPCCVRPCQPQSGTCVKRSDSSEL